MASRLLDSSRVGLIVTAVVGLAAGQGAWGGQEGSQGDSKAVGAAYGDPTNAGDVSNGEPLNSTGSRDTVDDCNNNGIPDVSEATWVEQVELTVPSWTLFWEDYFGWSVAMDGDRLAVGAILRLTTMDTPPGYVFVFHWNGAEWVEESWLPGWDAFSYYWDGFGGSVAIGGDHLVVGATRGEWLANAGAAYTYRRQGADWYYDDMLVPADAVSKDYFGDSVAIDGIYMVIGAPNHGHTTYYSYDGHGSAYVYQWDGTKWYEAAKLTASDATQGAHFGTSVDISDATIVVGASTDSHSGYASGSAYVFRREGSGWAQEAKLTTPNAAERDYFGTAVAISGDRLVVGATELSDPGNGPGGAYVFRRDGTAWIQEGKLTASDGVAADSFGGSVAINGGTVVVGARRDDDAGPSSGSAYVFHWDGTAWLERVKLTASDAATEDRFGNSVAMEGNRLAIGAYMHDDPWPDSDTGSVYVFVENDCNQNGIPDDCDIDFATSEDCTLNGIPDECEADCNDNGVADSCDIASGGSDDCTADGVPDECDPDCNNNGVADSCDVPFGFGDCNGNGVPDECDLANGTSRDCNANGRIDECDLLSGTSLDCNENGSPDECDLAFGTSPDCDNDDVPDECQTDDDCNENSVPDECDLADGTSVDCNDNAVPDECDVDEETSADCNRNGIPDECDLASGTSDDCNDDDIPDECEIEWLQQAELDASDAQPFTRFGRSVAVDDGRMAVGTYPYVYVLRWDGAEWIQEATLIGSDTEDGDWFGESVAISGDRIVVGAREDDDSGENSGSAYVFRRAGVEWIEEVKLIASDADEGDLFGASVAMSGDLIAVGAMGNYGTTGATYVFHWDGAVWVEEARLTASDTDLSDYFGGSVAINDDRLVVGAEGNDDVSHNSGSAYVFRRDETGWIEEARLIASDADRWDYFGTSVAISGDVVAVGAPGLWGAHTGSAYVFRRNGYTWVEEKRLTYRCGTGMGDRFGHAVALSGAYLVVGAPDEYGDDVGYDAGLACLFQWTGTTWIGAAKLTPDDALAYDVAGSSVAIEDDRPVIVVGAPGRRDPYYSAGAVYTFIRNDCNENGIIDECEDNIDCNDNDAPDECDLAVGSTADCNGNGRLDMCEYDEDCNNNDLRDICDIAEGIAEDDNGNMVPDACEQGRPARAAPPHDVKKNRYVSFDPNLTDTRAFQLELVSSEYFPASSGLTRWVGEPLEMCFHDECSFVSRVVDEPAYRAWPEDVVHIGDCEIVSVAMYAIRATADEVDFSEPLIVSTIDRPNLYWGDVAGTLDNQTLTFTPPSGFVNVTDIQAFLVSQMGYSGAPHTTWVDVHGEGVGSPPNYVLNVSDLQQLKLAFQGQTYLDSNPDHLDPADCP